MCATLLIGGGGRAGSASAQMSAGRFGAQSVLERTRPDYDPIGLRLGTFTILPSLDANTGYDSNVRALQSPVLDDLIFTLRPAVVARSNWSRNAVTVRASSDIQRFVDRPVENAEQYQIGADGRFDIGSRTHLVADARVGRLIEARGSTGDTALDGEPVNFMDYHFGTGADHDFGPLRPAPASRSTNSAMAIAKPRAGARSTTASAITARSSATSSSRCPSRLPPACSFAAPSIRPITSTNLPGRAAISTSYSALTGIAFGVTPLLYGSIGIGYFAQTYREPSLDGTNGLNYSAAITWNPTLLATASFTLNRALQRAPSPTLGAITTTTGTLIADYELRRNLIVGATAGYSRNLYGLIDRTQTQMTGSARATYLFSRLISSTLRLDYL
ncbi:outer membrane beta-barrel protein [Sphingomonas aerolata]